MIVSPRSGLYMLSRPPCRNYRDGKKSFSPGDGFLLAKSGFGMNARFCQLGTMFTALAAPHRRQSMRGVTRREVWWHARQLKWHRAPGLAQEHDLALAHFRLAAG